MIASNVMPSNAIVVDVVENGQARFSCSVDVKLSVVGLRLLLVAGLGEGIVVPAWWHLVSGSDLLAGGGPEPSQDVFGFQIGSVFTALEVTEPS